MIKKKKTFGFEIGKLYYSPQHVTAFSSHHPTLKTLTINPDVPYVLTDVTNEDSCWINLCILYDIKFPDLYLRFKKHTILEPNDIGKYIRRFPL